MSQFHRSISRAASASLLAAVLAGCASSSAEYVAQASGRGVAVTRGRLNRIDGLSSTLIETLADGRVIQVGGTGCQAALEFTDDSVQALELPRGAWIVFGDEGDYVLIDKVVGAKQ